MSSIPIPSIPLYSLPLFPDVLYSPAIPHIPLIGHTPQKLQFGHLPDSFPAVNPYL